MSGDSAGFRHRFLEGVARFNRADFFEAHEEWEILWLASSGDRRELLQGLIQLAAAFHHVKRGNAKGAQRLFTSSASRLSKFPVRSLGIDVPMLARIAQESSAGAAADFPKIAVEIDDVPEE